MPPPQPLSLRFWPGYLCGSRIIQDEDLLAAEAVCILWPLYLPPLSMTDPPIFLIWTTKGLLF